MISIHLRAWLSSTLLLLTMNACDGSKQAAAPGNPPAPTPAPVAPAPQPVLIAAASDLTPAFEELGPKFEQSSGQKVTFTFGSSGLLAKQIEQGGPFDLLAAANVSFVDQVVSGGHCDGSTKARYARGRIVVWTRKDATLPGLELKDLADARLKHVAIANPEHAPYGKAAKQALEKAALWSQVEPRIVYGENIKQTLQFAQSGNADAAIVALSLALASAGVYEEIPEAMHQPLEQALVVCKGGKNPAGAAAFAAYLTGAEGRATLARHGFSLPEGPTAAH